MHSPQLLLRIGQRLRQRRLELARTLADVATPADVSVSHLSNVEAGQTVPSLHVLARIVRVLGLSLNEVLRQADGALVDSGDIHGAARAAKPVANPSLRLRVVALSAEPGDRGDVPLGPGAHELFLLQYAGALELEVDGGVHVLHEGDSLHAVRPAAVAWTAVGDGRSVSLWATAGPGRPAG